MLSKSKLRKLLRLVAGRMRKIEWVNDRQFQAKSILGSRDFCVSGLSQ